jgi:addiction module HigA family antidote
MIRSFKDRETKRIFSEHASRRFPDDIQKRAKACLDRIMAKKEKLIPLTHPGEHLLEVLEDWGLTQYRLAKGLNVQQTRIMEIIKGRRAISADTSLRLAKFFDTTPEFWMNLQVNYDLAIAKRNLNAKLDLDVQPLLKNGNKVG